MQSTETVDDQLANNLTPLFDTRSTTRVSLETTKQKERESTRIVIMRDRTFAHEGAAPPAGFAPMAAITARDARRHARANSGGLDAEAGGGGGSPSSAPRSPRRAASAAAANGGSALTAPVNFEQRQDEEEDEHEHFSHRAPWLRAFVLGANDGLVSVASLMLGVGAASPSGDGAAAALQAMRVSGVAGLVAGALSMAVGEYISVSSQR
jgi:hypothetical protein